MNLLDEIFYIDPSLYASSGKRFLNFIIDRVLFYVIMIVISTVLLLGAEFFEIINVSDFILGLEDLDPVSDFLFTAILLVLYYFLFEYFTQGTIGKYITKTKVVDIYGNKPNATAIFYRSIMRIVPFEIFSFLGPKARGWHDTVSKTFVVDIAKYKRKKKNFNELEELGKTAKTFNKY